MRARIAAGPTARAITGRMYDSGPPRPATGNHPSETPKTQTRKTPSRKSGIVEMKTLLEVKPSSSRRPRPRRVATAIGDAGRDGDDHGDEEGEHREGGRCRQPLGDGLGDRQLRADRGAQVAREQPLDVVAGTAARSGRSGRATPAWPRRPPRARSGPCAARTGSPGTRCIMRNAAVTSTHSDASSRPERRRVKRSQRFSRAVRVSSAGRAAAVVIAVVPIWVERMARWSGWVSRAS